MSTAPHWKASLFQVKCSSIHLPVCLPCTSEWYMYLLYLHSHHHILPFPFFRVQTLFFHCCCYPSLSPPQLSLYLCFFLIVLNLYISLHLPQSPSFSHAAWFFHLVVFIFYPFISLSVSPPVCVFFYFCSILMFILATAVFRAILY